MLPIRIFPEGANVSIFRTPDVMAGILFVCLGGFIWWGAGSLDLGTLRSMGPGYAPRIVAVGMVILGGLLALRSLRHAGMSRVDIRLPPLALVLVPVAIFAVLAEPLGLPLTVLICTTVAQIGRLRSRPVEVLLLSIMTAVTAMLIFVVGLGLPLPLLPRI